MARRQNKLPTTRLLLMVLEQAGGTVADYWNFFHDLRRYQSAYVRGGASFVAELRQLRHDKTRVKQTLDALKRRQFIRMRHRAGKLMVELTDKGRRRTLQLGLRQARLLPRGTYTLVTFDIPEEVRSARQQLRLFLRQAGFHKLQQSVWISSHEVHEPLALFVHSLKLESWVTVCQASRFTKLPVLD